MIDTARLTTALANRYRIERELGEGGMATVYLAYDVRHDRHVALKELRPELAAVIGSDRFLKEIKVTAHLQHPHILGLIDSGEADGLLYYVMPFVEGQSLRDRLNHEKQLPIEDAVRITREVASALDYAHRHGVIHRDIKPENILLHEGQALVADFGIALALENAAGERLTGTGISLGTPQYMSPEQVTGEARLDARTDEYSLACVLYEMLAGQPPHTAPTVQSMIAKIVSEEPRPITIFRGRVPAHIAGALAQALAKLPADRFDTVREFSESLDRREIPVAPPGVARASAVMFPRWIVWAAALVLVALGAVAMAKWLTRTPVPSTVTRFAVPLPSGYSMLYGQEPDLAISPDGRTLVYRTGGRLFRRVLDSFDAQPIPGTEEAYTPFFSPDGAWLGFVHGSA